MILVLITLVESFRILVCVICNMGIGCKLSGTSYDLEKVSDHILNY